MVNNDYYGLKHATTYLEIYSQPNETDDRIVHRQLCDQEAYDIWHLSYYFKEILKYRRLMKRSDLRCEHIPRKEKNLLLYLIFSCEPRLSSLTEIGSSFFECIDGMEIVDVYLKRIISPVSRFDLKKLSYIGIEISEMLREASQVLHPSYNVTVYGEMADIENDFEVMYDRSVMNYMCESADEVASIMNRSEVTLTNTFFSKDETFESARLGKSLHYFSLREVLNKINKPLFHLFGEKAPGPASGQDLSRGRPVVEGF
ncbi:MAG: hypothetical protein J7M24_06850, partial [Candidatus Latescibacteria bacterium]|nr:hypothetical protein [Candidatus Latescibacterota bacterium]